MLKHLLYITLLYNFHSIDMTPKLSNACFDMHTNCPDLAQTKCYQLDVKAKCKLSCGLCPGKKTLQLKINFEKFIICFFLSNVVHPQVCNIRFSDDFSAMKIISPLPKISKIKVFGGFISKTTFLQLKVAKKVKSQQLSCAIRICRYFAHL